MTKTIAVPRELAEYAASVLIEDGCLPDEKEAGCAGCRMTEMGLRLKALLDAPDIRRQAYFDPSGQDGGEQR